MSFDNRKRLAIFLSAICWSIVCVGTSAAQTNVFTYQGRLTDGGAPANATYDMQFLLFDTPDVGSGTQQGLTVTNSAVQVTNGSFSVPLDFGPGVFDGSARYIEIGVRPAGSVNPYTTLSPRQPITSAPYAIRSATAGTADTATNATTASDTTQFGGLPPERFVQSDASGNVGIGTTIPRDGFPLNVNGRLLITPNPNGEIQFGSPSGETGMAVVLPTGGGTPTSRADVRFDGSTLKLVAVAGNVVPPSTNGIAIDTAGNVGIGTIPTPPAGIKLDVLGSARISLLPNKEIQFGSPGSETGLSIQHIVGANRADIRFDGSTLKLVTIDGGGVPGSSNGLAIDTAGNVGIGTIPTPPAGIKLDVLGAARISLPTNRAIQFGSPGSETGMSIQHSIGSNRADIRFDGLTLKLVTIGGGGTPGSANGIAIDTSGNVGINTTTPTRGRLQVEGGESNGVIAVTDNASRYAIFADGNAGQARDKGGWVKAMVLVDGVNIIRCYDAITNTTTGCPILAFNQGGGIGGGTVIRVAFPYQVDDRFISVTGFGNNPQIQLINSNSVDVSVGFGSTKFFLFVY